MCLPLHEAPEIQWSSLSYDICMRPGHHRNLGKKCCGYGVPWYQVPVCSGDGDGPSILWWRCLGSAASISVYIWECREAGGAIRTPQVREWIKNMWYNLTTGHIPWKVKVLLTQLCPSFCDPMDCSTPNSSVHGTLQVRMLEWVAIPFSKVNTRIPWRILEILGECQGTLSRYTHTHTHIYLPHSGIEPGSPVWQAYPLPSEPPGKPAYTLRKP